MDYYSSPGSAAPNTSWNQHTNHINHGVGNTNMQSYGNNHFPSSQNYLSMPPPHLNPNRPIQPHYSHTQDWTRPLPFQFPHTQPPNVRMPPPINVNRPPPPIDMNRPLPSISNPVPSRMSHFQSSCLSQDLEYAHVPPRLQKEPSHSSFAIPHQQNKIQIMNHIPPNFKNLHVPSVNQLSPPDVLTTQASGVDQFESAMERKRQIGKQNLSSWLQKIGKIRRKVNTESKEKHTSIKINDYLCKLHHSMSLIGKMSKQVEKLESMISDTDRSSWQKESDAFEALKTEQKNLESGMEKSNVNEVKRQLTRLKSKRVRMKKSYQRKHQQKQETEEARAVREKEISDWQQKLRSEMKEELLKKKRKQEMDQTLSTVTKNIQDANRLIETMKALEKLRLIRQDAAKKRGDADLGESRQSFEQKIADMTRLVESQLEVYKEEEQTLRGALKSEQDELSKKEKQIQERKDEEDQRQKEEDLRKTLFGFVGEASPADRLFPYQQYYNQAQANLSAFIQIRHEWDQWIVPNDHPQGSTIPQQWVVPCDPSSLRWAGTLSS